MNPVEQGIYEKAIELWGEPLQKVMAIEEMSELTKALTKNIRGKDNIAEISEEIADVEIMLGQLKVMFNNDNVVKRFKAEKLKKVLEMFK